MHKERISTSRLNRKWLTAFRPPGPGVFLIVNKVRCSLVVLCCVCSRRCVRPPPGRRTRARAHTKFPIYYTISAWYIIYKAYRLGWMYLRQQYIPLLKSVALRSVGAPDVVCVEPRRILSIIRSLTMHGRGMTIAPQRDAPFVPLMKRAHVATVLLLLRPCTRLKGARVRF